MIPRKYVLILCEQLVNLLVLGGVAALPSFGQSSIQVVTKTIEKEWPYSSGEVLKITAEKAEVTVLGWSKNTVHVRLRLVAKHPDRAVAEKEVSYLRYILDHEKTVFSVGNRFVIPQTAPPVRSNLKAYYELHVPFMCVVYLQNTYGSARLGDLRNGVQATLEFSNLELSEIRGSIEIQSEYSDIMGTALNGNLVCKANKAKLSFADLNGTASIENSFGSIGITPGSSLTSLRVNASRTDITFHPQQFGQYRYSLSTRFAEIHVPDHVSAKYRKNVLGKQVFEYTPQNQGPLAMVNLETSYSPIIIRLR